MNHKQSQTSTPPNLVAGLDIGTTTVLYGSSFIRRK